MGKIFDALPDNYRAFISELVVSGNKSEAARKAGKDLLKKPELRDALQEFREEIAESLQITLQPTLFIPFRLTIALRGKHLFLTT